MRIVGEPRFRLGPVVRGSLDTLKLRVLKKRARRHAAHIDKSIKHMNGSHAWAIRRVRTIAMLGLGEPIPRYRRDE